MRPKTIRIRNIETAGGIVVGEVVAISKASFRRQPEAVLAVTVVLPEVHGENPRETARRVRTVACRYLDMS